MMHVRSRSGLTGDAVGVRHMRLSVSEGLRRAIDPAVGYGFPFLLVLYLALKGGGYDEIVRSEVGIAVWWIVVLGVAVGVLPRAGVPPLAWVGLGLLSAFAVWTALGVPGSESAERTVAEVARVVSFLGVFALASFAQDRETLRRTGVGIAAAIGVVGTLALLSRLHPQWFPADETAATLGTASDRLNYPLNYWNGLATLLAMGLPLLLVAATRVKNVLASGLFAAAMPVAALAAFYTFSRGGAVEIGIALVVVIAFFPNRLSLLPTLLTVGLGSTVLVAAATQRDALESGVRNAQSAAQGDEMIAMTLVVAAAVALLQVAITLAASHGIGPRPHVSRRAAIATTGIAAAVAVGAALAGGVPGGLSERWAEFKETPAPSAVNASRFESAGGGGRYDFWTGAVDANATDPLMGIGAGTFEFWEARAGDYPGFVRDAHSLYFESLAEVGIVGLALIVGLIGLVLVVGAARALGAAPDDRQVWIAGALASCTAFAAAAAVDWVWELTVLPVTFMILAAAILGPRLRTGQGANLPRPAISTFRRAGLAIAATFAIAAIAIPLASASSLRDSQAQANDGSLSEALNRAQRAASIEPYAATPVLQEALVLERQGDLTQAALAAASATEDEPTNWRTWLVLSRIEAHRGRVEESIDAYRTARSLNPRSDLFR